MRVKHRRSKGTGTLEKRGNIWYARWWDRDGKRHFETTRCTNRDDAERKLDEFVKADLILNENQKLEYVKAKIETNLGLVKKIKRHEILFDNLLEKFFETNSIDVTQGTRKGYRFEMKTLTDWLKDNHPSIVYVDDMTEDMAKEYLAYKRKLVGNDTLNQSFFRLKRIWRCMGFEPIWSFYKRLRPSEQTRDTFTDEQIQDILELLRKKKHNWYEFILTIILTGMRRSDATSLNVRDVDLVKCTMRKRMKKNRVRETVPIHPLLVQILSSLTPDEQGYYFPHQHKIYNPNKVFENVLKELGITTSYRDENGKIKHSHSLHSLRHYFVSAMANQGVALQLCANFISDKSRIVKKYYHTDITAMRSQLTSIPQLNDLSKNINTIDAVIIDEKTDISVSKKLLEEIQSIDSEKSIEENLKTLLTAYRKSDNITVS